MPDGFDSFRRGIKMAAHFLDRIVELPSQLVEPFVDTVEPFVNTVEPFIKTVEPFAKTVESLIHTGKPDSALNLTSVTY